MRFLDLFSGIGGFSLGLERAGHRTVAFCEIEPFCRAILAKHWPGVPIYNDVRDLTAERLKADGISVDAICGGFPCQDISYAGKGIGIDGERSGLWSEYARLICEIRPKYIIVENVAALLRRGIERVLGDLATFGYDAEWNCIPACAVGAKHIRDRIWIVAYPRQEHSVVQLSEHGQGAAQQGEEKSCRPPRFQNGIKLGLGRSHIELWRSDKPPVCGMVDDVPRRLDRLGSLGNSVVPAIPEILGKCIND